MSPYTMYTCLFNTILLLSYHAFSFSYKPGGITLLDHLNMNHEMGRHDLLKQFYFETLGLAIDPRKEENLSKGKGGVWANWYNFKYRFYLYALYINANSNSNVNTTL